MIRRWTDGFDGRAAEVRLNAALPQSVVAVARMDVHVVHLRAADGGGLLPVLLTHGWPGCFAELVRFAPLGVDPRRNGEPRSSGRDLVIPALPGHPMSPGPDGSPGLADVADLWVELMQALGYERIIAAGDDWGAHVSPWLARRHPARVAGVHLSDVPGTWEPAQDGGSASQAERGWIEARRAWNDEHGVYYRLQETEPDTLAHALADPPSGLLAWLAARFAGWADPRTSLSKDDILTMTSPYWFAGAIGPSMRLYGAVRESGPPALRPGERIEPPVAVAAFPGDSLPLVPRERAERFLDVRRWTVMPRGGTTRRSSARRTSLPTWPPSRAT